VLLSLVNSSVLQGHRLKNECCDVIMAAWPGREGQERWGEVTSAIGQCMYRIHNAD
jgi:hypothetical protein